jgi:hypothetical protein
VCSGSEGIYPRPKVANNCLDTSVIIWDAKTFSFVKRIQQARAVKSLATVNGFILSGSSDGSMRQYSAKVLEVWSVVFIIYRKRMLEVLLRIL